MTISLVEVGVKWRPGPSELVELGPEFKEVWDSLHANAPDKPVLWMGIFSACLTSNQDLLPQRKYFTMATRTVSTMALAMPAGTPSDLTLPRVLPTYDVHLRSRSIPSRAATHTSRMLRTSPLHLILSPATSNR